MEGSRRNLDRRHVLKQAGLSVAGVAVLAGCTAPTAGDEPDDGEEDDSADEPTTHEVLVGPDGEFVYTPGTEEPLEIDPGDTVQWIWESDAHNVNPTEIPDDSTWEGHQDIEDTGFEYEHTFEVEGNYHYVCDPHVDQGMVADLVVGDPPEVDDEEDVVDDEESVADDEEDDVDEEEDLDDEDEAEEFYTFDDPVDATGEDVVEIITREGEDDEPSFVFDPYHVVVDEGTTIEWVNTDGVFHTVTSTDDIDTRRGGGDEFDSTISSEGDTFEWLAEEPGSQPYYCSPHAAFMYGIVEIE